MDEDLGRLDATDQARLVATAQVSAADMVAAGLDRIADRNGVVNAVVVDLSEKAAATTPSAGPLHGVPVLVKDSCATAGDPSYHGMRALRDAGWSDAYDQWSTSRLRRAGAVICGKTNMCELGTSITTEPVAFGATRNPWDLARSPGGSSGGSAAAVAAGMVAAAQGTDGGGSVRIPAARCGIVGLKPSRARISAAPAHGEQMGGLLVEGVLTRTTRDAALLLDVLHGPAPGDPYGAPPPHGRYVDQVRGEPPRLRVGVYRDVPGRRRALHDDCRAAVLDAAQLLGTLGHDVDVSAPPALDGDALGREGPKLYWVAYAAMLSRWERALGRPLGRDDVEPLTWAFVDRGRALSAPAYVAAQEAMHRLSRDVAEWHATGFDVLLMAATAEPPPPLGAWTSTVDDPLRAARAGMATSQLNSVANHTGQPAISLPLGRSRDGLPLGVQLLAPYGREDVLLAVAAQIERATGWSQSSAF